MPRGDNIAKKMNIGKNIVVILLLPFDYYRCNDGAPITGYGFFVYKDTVLLGDYAPPCYDPEKTDGWLKLKMNMSISKKISMLPLKSATHCWIIPFAKEQWFL